MQMTLQEIAELRLTSLQLTRQQFTTPHDLVSYLGAVQAQDYLSAQWALGMRLTKSSAEVIDAALAEGSIIRTHIMRPTWHFVAPEDLRWMQKLTADRVRPTLAYYNRQLGLDEAIQIKTRSLLHKTLRNNAYHTRDELKKIFESHGMVIPSGQYMAHILFDAELAAILCSGPRRGKQFTYALVDERIPQTLELPREEALTVLTKRFFTSHGPATIKDFSWWSGLSVTDSKRGIALMGNEIQLINVEGIPFYYTTPLPTPVIPSVHVSLQPAYDEYTIAYQNHEPHFPETFKRADLGYGYFILINGQISGTWKRVLNKTSVVLSVQPFRKFSEVEQVSLQKEAERYADFWKLQLTLQL